MSTELDMRMPWEKKANAKNAITDTRSQVPVNPVPVCITMLPARVRSRLLQAVNTDPDLAPGESPLRTRELDRAIFHARVGYPHLFRQ